MRWIALCACLGLFGLAGCQNHSATTPSPEPERAPALTSPEAEEAPAEPPAAREEEAPPAESGSEAEAAQAPEEKPVYDTGPLRVEINAMRDTRTVYFDSEERSATDSYFAMQVRVRGERLKEIKSFGNLILTELVDETGRSLLDDDTYTEEQKTMMRRMTVPEKRLKEFGLQVATRAKLGAREAQHLKTVRGTIRLIMADKTEKYTILDPLQYFGKTIEDSRLEELELEVRIVPPDEFEHPTPNQCLVLQFKTKGEYVAGVTFFDGHMRQMPVRERQAITKSEDACTAYCFQKAEFDNEMQLVLEVYPELEDIQLPLEAENVKLP
ncbi:MAG: hypothetical protein KAY37_03345 [Phycisphaerae bacterium]|nr:hypothetical protein [Phycisphaerae bacterium]